jgi:hypothetical protein
MQAGHSLRAVWTATTSFARGTATQEAESLGAEVRTLRLAGADEVQGGGLHHHRRPGQRAGRGR